MHFCLLLLGLLCYAQSAAAQIRIVGSLPLRVLQPQELASDKQARAYNQAAIEATLEAAFRAGRLCMNLPGWQQLEREIHAKGWSLSFSPPDTTALHSLRTQGYFRGPFDRKTYVLYLEPAAAFYVVSVVNIYLGSGELGIEQIRPAHRSDTPLVLSKSKTKRYLDSLFEELVCRNALALSPKGQVYWKARWTMRNVSLKQCQ